MNASRPPSPASAPASIAGRRALVRSLPGLSVATLALGSLISGVHSAAGREKPRRARKAKAKTKSKPGRAGPPGPPGPVGPAGAAGPTATFSVALGARTEFDVPTGGANDGNSSCDTGVAIGVNMQLTNPACGMVGSEQSGSNVKTWVLTIQCPENQASPGNTVQAICLT